jgi:hypothetical protein
MTCFGGRQSPHPFRCVGRDTGRAGDLREPHCVVIGVVLLLPPLWRD